MKFICDYEKKLAKKLGLNIMKADYAPETYLDRQMAQPGIFVFNNDNEIVYSYIKEGKGPWGRPMPQSLFPIIAQYAPEYSFKESKENKNEDDSNKEKFEKIPEKAFDGIKTQTKEEYKAQQAEMESKGLW
eukprot:CAMPEP_0197519104 /NCGR_PEP_ID=MMETSP1318-20131121/4371_1 /TAXON_ID=552666 /ORGANISM="Partenskyella glossopodia, Strain RCC365" /LENGTH=130 /DNA_ID=CAMNT_0043069899 /DNA_START=90 /DNA_END=479 /DNA_ORIENTATION=+